jgi:transposase-like protein
MQQGKPYTPEEKAQIIESLKPYLEMGFSRRKACAFVGFDDTTLSKWVQADKGLSTKLTGWENALSALALANVHKALRIESETEDARVDSSWRYLERREDGFKPKQDITSDNEAITNVNINVVTQPTSEQDTGEELSEQN